MRPSGVFHRHVRLIVAALIGLGAGLAAVGLDGPQRVLIGADLFFAIYLALVFLWLRGRAGRDLRAHFEDGDEGAVWISALAVGIVVVSLYAIIATIIGASSGVSGAAGQAGARGGVGPMGATLALAAVPLGWITLHTVMALHYAGLFYRAEDRLARGEGVEQNSPRPVPARPAPAARTAASARPAVPAPAVPPARPAPAAAATAAAARLAPDAGDAPQGPEHIAGDAAALSAHSGTPAAAPAAPSANPAPAPRDRGGLDFSGDWPEPGPWEFLYYSFTMGMTAQTSDTAVTSTEMRRVTLVHGILSYFYNAVIVALAVNVGLSLGQ